MNMVRVERRLIRAGRERARMDLRGLIVVALMCALFVSCFAVGRATSGEGSGGGASRGEAASSVVIAPAGAAIPIRLSSAPPMQLGPPATVRHSNQAASIRAVAPPAQAVSTEALRPQASGTEAPQALPSPSQPAAPIAPAPAPAQVPSSSGSGGSSGFGGGHSKPSSGGGGSFESSG
jgi:hypothetical protein